jgi:hypothetical protein
MGKMRFAVGALGIILGFFVYQYGFFLTLKLSDSLASWTMSYVPWIGSVPVLGAALQLIGGVIAIVGLLICISWIGSQRVSLPSIRPQRTGELVSQVPDSAPKCKFCGAILESGMTFCPSCQRAQA